jgi:hypothetical protein
MLGIYRVAAQLAASRVILSSTELVSQLVTQYELMYLEVGIRANSTTLANDGSMKRWGSVKDMTR